MKALVLSFVLCLVAGALLTPAATSQTPGAESHLDASCESGFVADETSTTDSVSHASTGVAASASAAARRLHAESSVQGGEEFPGHRYCSVLTRFDNAVTIGPGTTGKAAGAPVSLALTVRLNGHLSPGYHGPPSPPGQKPFDAATQFYAEFELTDPNRPVCRPDEGHEVCRPAELAGFWAEAREELHAGLGWEHDPDGNVSGRKMWGWELTGNRGDHLGDGEDDTRELCAAWPGPFPCAATDVPPPLSPDYRGVRTVLVDTFVGARLELRGLLTILPQATADAHASAHFAGDEGFGVDLAPAAGFEGLGLVYDLGTPPPHPAPLPSLTISDTTVTEGDSGQTAAAFTVALSAAGTEPVLLSYSTLSGTATGDDDYANGGGFLTFAPGELEKTVTVAVAGDEANEDDETFFVEIQEAVGATIGDRLGVATILDDDEPVTAAGLIAEVEAELESRVEAGRGTKLADKLEDALHKVNAALSKLQAGDRTGCVGELEGAVGEVRATMAEGLLPAQDGVSLLERLTAAARRIADDSIAAAQNRGGSAGKIAEAQQLVARGDSGRVRGQYKEAVASYKDAVSKASGA